MKCLTMLPKWAIGHFYFLTEKDKADLKIDPSFDYVLLMTLIDGSYKDVRLFRSDYSPRKIRQFFKYYEKHANYYSVELEHGFVQHSLENLEPYSFTWEY